MTPYKILILSCNTGEGHNSAARALQNYARSVGIDCDLLDALSLRYERISKIVSGLYDASVKLSLFSSIYALGEWYSDRKHNGKSPVYHLCKLLRGRLSQVISDNAYNAVICIFGLNSQEFLISSGTFDSTTPLQGRAALKDTMEDLILDFAGSTVIAVAAFFDMKRIQHNQSEKGVL